MKWLLNFLGAVAGVINWLLNREQQRIGAQKQKLADAAATIKGSENAQRVGEQVRGMSDADLDKRLADSMRGPSTDR